MLSSISHDLRTPLAALRASVEAIRDGVAEDPDASLKGMEHQVQALAVLVDDLQLHTRLASGTLAMRPSRVDLTELADEAVETLRPLATAERCATGDLRRRPHRCDRRPRPARTCVPEPDRQRDPARTARIDRSRSSCRSGVVRRSCGWSTRARGFRQSSASGCSTRSPVAIRRATSAPEPPVSGWRSPKAIITAHGGIAIVPATAAGGRGVAAHVRGPEVRHGCPRALRSAERFAALGSSAHPLGTSEPTGIQGCGRFRRSPHTACSRQNRRRLGLMRTIAQPPAVMPQANESCWCGSGRKYKRCHKKLEGRVLPGEVSPMRTVPDHIVRPSWADTGEPVMWDEAPHQVARDHRQDASCRQGRRRDPAAHRRVPAPRRHHRRGRRVLPSALHRARCVPEHAQLPRLSRRASAPPPTRSSVTASPTRG